MIWYLKQTLEVAPFSICFEKMYEGSKLQRQYAFQISKDHFKYYNLHIRLAVALECLKFCSFKTYTKRENFFKNQKTPATNLFDPELKDVL